MLTPITKPRKPQSRKPRGGQHTPAPLTPRTALHIRRKLLSFDPATQDKASRALGQLDPHIELVAITSALHLDAQADRMTRRLSIPHVKRMINATVSHLALLDHLPTHTQADLHAKAQDVFDVAKGWMHAHDHGLLLAPHVSSLIVALQS